MWKKVKLLKMSNFTFFHNVFYAICILESSISHISVVVCNFFEFGKVSKWCIREWVNTIFRHQFSYISVASAPVHAFLEFLSPVFHTIFIQSHWLLFYVVISKQLSAVKEDLILLQWLSSVLGEKFAELGIKPAMPCSQVLYTTG